MKKRIPYSCGFWRFANAYSVSIIERIENAFSELADKGMLKQGAGIFEFEDFQIHI